MTQWNSLFYNTSSDAIPSVQQALTQLEYELYHAFDLIPGKAYPDTLKTFIAPALSPTWTHILVDPDTDIDDLTLFAETLSQQGLCLLAHLDNSDKTIELYQAGDTVDIAQLQDHLLAGKSGDDLSRALEGRLPLPTLETADDEQSQILAISDLPPEMRMLAQGLNPSKSQNMFQRFASNFMGRGDAERAQDLINADKLDWNSAGGMVIRGVLACIIEGDAWLSPDFVTIREAYQRHSRKQRRPSAKLYPGDQQMMDAVPNALDYTPIYGGQD